jgi:hypothetical protein
VSSLTMPNFDAYRHKLKKFQHWPHSLLIVRGRWKTIFVMGVLEVPWNFKRSVPTKILRMEMMDDENETWTISMIMCRVDGCH